MGYMKNKIIYAEMARRKVQFHKNEDWSTIKLWGLFSWGAVSRMINDGRLKTPSTYTRENKTVWVYPTAEVYEKHIKPLIEKYTLEELTTMSGWDD